MADRTQATLVISGPDFQQTVDVSLGTFIFGRQTSTDIPLSSSLVSRQHARLVCDESGCRLEDLNSSNGTLLNGELLDPEVPTPLQHGDLIEIGPFQLHFEQASAALPADQDETPPEDVLLEEGAPSLAVPDDEASSVEVPPSTPPEAEPEPDYVAGQVDLVSTGPPAGTPPTPPLALEDMDRNGSLQPMPPGLERYSTRLLNYLPPIYHSDFMSRFLALFESILMPVEWTIDGFDMFLDPETAPAGFLPWLANWYMASFDDTWNEAQQRTFLKEAHKIYARRGTRWAMERILEIYTETSPQIDDDSPHLEPLTFRVHIPRPESDFDRELVENLIDSHKPAHTIYQLTFEG